MNAISLFFAQIHAGFEGMPLDFLAWKELVARPYKKQRHHDFLNT